MPGSAPAGTREEDVIRQRAIQLAQRGFQAGAYIDPGDPYLGNAIDMGNVYYQSPKVPGYHFQQQYIDGAAGGGPRMLPGSLDSRIALELARQAEMESREAGDWRRYGSTMTPEMLAYERIVEEADRRARGGRPIRRPRS